MSTPTPLPRPDADVIVIGGGPVGVSAAIHAAMGGLDACVLEPKRGPIDKACGEGLMPGALAGLQRIGVDPAGADMRGISYADGTHYVSADFTEGLGRGVRRTELHRCLRARAETLGVRFVEASMRGLTQDDHGVTVTLGSSGPSLRSRYAVGADGLHSRTRRLLGLERGTSSRRRPPLGLLHRSGVSERSRRFGYRQHFHLAPWTDRVEVHWGRHAEVYVTPVAHDTIGVAVLTTAAGSFADHLAVFPDLMDRLSGADHASDLRGSGPLRQQVTSRAQGRVLLVGDAGGYVDALTGEGLAVGLAQARVAVEALRDGDPDRYPGLARRVSWRSTTLTSSLLYATRSAPLRAAVVPAAARLPWAFQWAVGELAST
ncbi:MAG: NAD(P)/FAD-dependent oxidoreductase [Ornithinimicrobium sp.]